MPLSLSEDCKSLHSSCSSMASFMSTLIQDISTTDQTNGDKLTIQIVADNAKLDSNQIQGMPHTQSLVTMQRKRSDKQISRWGHPSVSSRGSDLNLPQWASSGTLGREYRSSENFRKITSDTELLQIPSRKLSPRLTSKTKALPHKKGRQNSSENATWASMDVEPEARSQLFDLSLSLGVAGLDKGKPSGDKAIMVPRRRVSREVESASNAHVSSPTLPMRKSSIETGPSRKDSADSMPTLEENEISLQLTGGPREIGSSERTSSSPRTASAGRRKTRSTSNHLRDPAMSGLNVQIKEK